MKTTLTKTIERSPEAHETVSGNAGADMKVSNNTINSPLRGSRSEALDKKGKTPHAAENARAQAGDRVELHALDKQREDRVHKKQDRRRNIQREWPRRCGEDVAVHGY